MTESEVMEMLENANEEEIQKILAALHLTTDFPEYAKQVLKVQTPKAKIVPFELNEPQKILHDIVEKHIRPKRLVRLVALKARRMGFSTYFSGRYYEKTSCNHNHYALQITHEPDATDFLFKMVKRFYNLSPEHMRPETLYNNTKLLEFNNQKGTGLNSAFRVATAGKDDVGSGQLIHFLHLCLAPDTPIIVEDGRECRIEDIQIGQRVVTHTGKCGVVSDKVKTLPKDLPHGNKAIVVRPWMGSDMVMTPEHKVWTNMGWIPAGELDKNWHMVSMPIREITSGTKSIPLKTQFSKYGPKYHGPAEVELDESAGYFVGYYLAEGCLQQTRSDNDWYHRISLTLHKDEDAFLDKALEFADRFAKNKAKRSIRKGTQTKVSTINSTVLANFLHENFGDSSNKHIPDWVFDCGEEFCRGIIAGYIAGDGSKGIGGSHQGYQSNGVAVSSIRESLVYQVRDMVAALGYGWGTIKYREGFVCNRGRNNKPQWTLYLSGNAGKRVREIAGIPVGETNPNRTEAGERYRLDPYHKCVWIRLKGLREAECDHFYDIEVDHEDHSFRTPSFSVSNSETAKWKPANTKSLLTSVLQCVPDDPVTEVVFESTAKGIGGEFYDRFWKARYRVFISGLDDNGDAIVEETVNEKADESNIYTSIFLPWFVFEDYRLPVPQDFEITEDEQQVKERFNLSDEQIAWRRWTINNKCDGSLDIFNQEYPDNPMAAFLGSGRPVFNVNKLADLVEIAPSPIARYEYHAGHWTSSMNGRLRVWEEPRSGGYYVIGADVAENTVDGDFCCADVIDRQTGKQVAQWHGNVAYDNIHEYADILMALGKRYNMAVLAPERNNHGVAVVTQLFHYKYKNLYVELVPDPPNKPRKRYGWVTSRTTKPLIIDNLISEVTEGTHGIQCRDTLEEMMSFKLQDNGKMEADVGMHDDRVMSYAIAKYVVQTQPSSRRSYNPLTDSFVRRKKGKKVKREAWT